MEQRPFGNTGLTVSALGFGAGHIGDASLTEDEAGTLLNVLADEGITLFDTARSYGASEERIGRHLAHRRHQLVLSTKIGYGIDGIADWTPDIIEPGVDRALSMLRTDYLDIVHLHSCSFDVLQRGDVIDALERCVQSGKVRVAAYSGDNEEADHAAQRFRAIQTSINLFDQRAIDHLLPVARERGIAVIAKRPLANAPWRGGGEYVERFDTMQLDRGELSWEELALRFTLGVEGVSTAITGSRSLANMRTNIAIAARGPLPPEIHNAIRDAFRRHEWRGVI